MTRRRASLADYCRDLDTVAIVLSKSMAISIADTLQRGRWPWAPGVIFVVATKPHICSMESLGPYPVYFMASSTVGFSPTTHAVVTAAGIHLCGDDIPAALNILNARPARKARNPRIGRLVGSAVTASSAPNDDNAITLGSDDVDASEMPSSVPVIASPSTPVRDFPDVEGPADPVIVHSIPISSTVRTTPVAPVSRIVSFPTIPLLPMTATGESGGALQCCTVGVVGLTVCGV